MKKGILILVGILGFLIESKAQELDFRVIINSDRSRFQNTDVFGQMKTSFEQFLNGRTWTSDEFRPENAAVQKIKKAGEELTLRLVPNVDLAFELGKTKSTKQIHVGFALETEQEEANAKAKLERKNFDLVVLNSATEDGVGFKHDTNQVRIFHKGGNEVQSALLPKDVIAELILEEVKKAAS